MIMGFLHIQSRPEATLRLSLLWLGLHVGVGDEWGGEGCF